MKTTKLLIALAIALGTTAASAAPEKYNAAMSDNDAATATTTAQKWTQAGNRELQQENARTALDHQGFPQYNS